MENKSIDNIIVIVVDALRADRVGALGSERSLTPNFDSFAERSVVFENAYSCTNATDPSIFSIHTGRFPQEAVYHQGRYVTDKEISIAETVATVPKTASRLGYRTVATGGPLGRFHTSGFDTYPVPSYSHEFRSELMNTLQAYSRKLQKKFRNISSPSKEEQDIAALVDEIGNTDGPFYGFSRLMDTHIPYDVSPEIVNDLLSTYEYPNRDVASWLNAHEDTPHVNDVLRDLVDPEWEHGIGRLFAQYDAAVVEADKKVGVLIDYLEESGLIDSTAVFVMSDHGESLDEHGIWFDHHGLYDQSIHVPLFAHLPGEMETGFRSAYVQLCDVGRTLFDLIGEPPSEPIAGNSLLPVIRGETDKFRDAIFATESHAHSRHAVRTPDWKFIEHIGDPIMAEHYGDTLKCRRCNTTHGGREELYDLKSDPDEREDVSGDLLRVVDRLQQQRIDFFNSLNVPDDVRTKQITYGHEDELKEYLEDLGYR